MYRLKEEGKIRLVGQSAYSHKDFVKLIPKVKPDVLQSFANPVERAFIDDGNPTRKLMEENQISFVAFRPLYEGLLLDKYKKKILRSLKMETIEKGYQDSLMKVLQSLKFN